MGCDIHSVFEVKGDDGVWRAIYVEDPTEDDLKRLRWRTEDALESGVEPPKGVTLEYHDRNYNVFAILANVRNGYGFAGVSTGMGFEPIAPNRGLPDDASPEILARSESYGVDGHSHTWATLAEILDTNWQKKVTTLFGIVSTEEYLAWRKANEGLENPVGPDSYCGGVLWGRDIHVIDDTAAEQMLAADGEIPKKVSHVRVRWAVTYAESAKWFLEFIYAKVVPLGYDPEGVRMVMFYDN